MRRLQEGVHGKESRLTVTRQDLIPWRHPVLPEDMLTPPADTDPTRERGPRETNQTQGVPPDRAVTLECPAEIILDLDTTKGLPVETNHELGIGHHLVTETEDPHTDHSLVHHTDPSHQDIHPETDEVGHPTGQTIRAETALDPREILTI
jgi:hypothetical protein